MQIEYPDPWLQSWLQQEANPASSQGFHRSLLALPLLSELFDR